MSYNPPNYTDIGHDKSAAPPAPGKKHAKGASELWYWHGGVKRHQPKNWDEINHHQIFRKMNIIPTAYGRIDHKQKKVSITGDNMSHAYDKALGKVQGEFPDYHVHEFGTEYMDIGHGGHGYKADPAKSEVWWHVRGSSSVEKRPAGDKYESIDHHDYAEFRKSEKSKRITAQGRIDHKNKTISYAQHRGAVTHPLTMHRAIRRQLESDHPDYHVHEFAVPASKDNYYKIGHQSGRISNQSDVDLWWMHGGDIKLHKSRALPHAHEEGRYGYIGSSSYGRVDHHKAAISVLHNTTHPAQSETLKRATVNKLKEKYPEYDVHEFAAAYQSVGHDDNPLTQLWWAKGDKVTTRPTHQEGLPRPIHHIDCIGPMEWDARGRIDHAKKEISLAKSVVNPDHAPAVKAAKDQFAEKYPTYEVKEFAASGDRQERSWLHKDSGRLYPVNHNEDHDDASKRLFNRNQNEALSDGHIRVIHSGWSDEGGRVGLFVEGHHAAIQKHANVIHGLIGKALYKHRDESVVDEIGPGGKTHEILNSTDHEKFKKHFPPT